MSTEKPRLGYWDIRGLAQPIRFIMAYVGADFEDERYFCGPAPDYNRDAWFSVKFSLGLPFPNLPYYIDDQVKLTGTNAILRYLGRMHKLDGDDDVSKATCDLMLEQTMDLRNAFIALCYGPDFENNKAAYIEKAEKMLDSFETFLGKNKFFAGEKITVCDFHMFEMLDQHHHFMPALILSRPYLHQYWNMFRNLPAIKAYMDSDKFKARPINNVMASFK